MFSKKSFSITKAYSRNLWQRSILARKGTCLTGNFYEKWTLFLKKGPKNFTLPYLIPFLSVLHQNKASHNFCKRRQRSIVEHNIGLEYALITKNKETPVQVFSHEFCEIFNKNFFTEHFWATASITIFFT